MIASCRTEHPIRLLAYVYLFARVYSVARYTHPRRCGADAGLLMASIAVGGVVGRSRLKRTLVRGEDAGRWIWPLSMMDDDIVWELLESNTDSR